MEVKIANEIRRLTAGAEAMSEQFLVAVVFRSSSELLLRMNINKIINRDVIFWNIYLKNQMFLYSMKCALQFQRSVSITQIKFLIETPENYRTKLSRIWACFQNNLLEFNISRTKKSRTRYLFINSHFKTDFLFCKNTQNDRKSSLTRFFFCRS